MFSILSSLNNSKFFAGIALLVFNVGSKYLSVELSETQDQLLKHVIFRRFALFTLFFVATRDVLFSLVLTALFIIFVSNLFNENSKYCILNKKKKTFNKKKITQEEYIKSLKIKTLFEKQIQNEIRNY